MVTQRLKQAGMHWSKKGAEGVMATTLALEGILTPSRGLDLSEFPTYGKAEN